MKTAQGHVNKSQLARSLGISRMSLYYTKTMPAKDEALKAEIEQVMEDNKAYGHKRIAMELGIGHNRVKRVMKKYGLKPLKMRKRPPEKNEDQNKAPAPYDNVLQRPCPIRPCVVWSGDFTYLWWNGVWLYLATIIDVFTREIVGFALSRHHTKELVIRALNDAVANSGNVSAYFHSDQGSEYDSEAYKARLMIFGIEISMSEKASPWQNPYKESFYSHFKLELGSLDVYENLGEVMEAICRQIHYYNTRRIHTALKMPPRAFRVLQETNCRQTV